MSLTRCVDPLNLSLFAPYTWSSGSCLVVVATKEAVTPLRQHRPPTVRWQRHLRGGTNALLLHGACLSREAVSWQ
jgi:hypothetical protein